MYIVCNWNKVLTRQPNTDSNRISFDIDLLRIWIMKYQITMKYDQAYAININDSLFLIFFFLKILELKLYNQYNVIIFI